MKLLLFISGMCVGIACTEKPAQAQNYPWCAIYSGGASGGGTNCGFTTFEQCMETARGLGSLCQPNTQYQPPPGSHGLARIPRHYPY